jgi:hypothetical protein
MLGTVPVPACSRKGSRQPDHGGVAAIDQDEPEPARVPGARPVADQGLCGQGDPI